MEESNNMKQCSFCGEMIKETAIKCRYCQSWLNEQKPSQAVTPISVNAQQGQVNVPPLPQVAHPAKPQVAAPTYMANRSASTVPPHIQQRPTMQQAPTVVVPPPVKFPKYEMKIEEEVVGPFEVSELRSQGIRADTQVRAQGNQDWLPAWADKITARLFSYAEIKQVKPRMFAHPFSFEGRIRRKEWGLSYLIWFVSGFFLYLLSVILLTLIPSFFTLIFILLLDLPIIWFITAQGSKRCHDYGDSGWTQFNWLLPAFIGGGIVFATISWFISFLPETIHLIIIVLLASLVIFGSYWSVKDMFIEEGMAYTNKYGPDPKAGLLHDTDEKSERYKKWFKIVLGGLCLIYMALCLLVALAQGYGKSSSERHYDTTLTTAPTDNDTLDTPSREETPSQEDALDDMSSDDFQEYDVNGDSEYDERPVIVFGKIQGPLGRMNLRSSPSKADDSNIIDKLENGTEVYYYYPSSDSEWVIVRLNRDGRDLGYVSAKGVTFVSQ